MSIRKLFNSVASTERLSDVAGSNRESYSANLTNFRCHIQPVTGDSQLLGEAGGFFKAFRMYCPSGTDIIEGDKVISGGSTYMVQGTLSRNFGRGSGNQHLEVILMLTK